MTAKGAFFLGDRTIEVRDMDLARPGPGDVLIKNMAAGICGTDVHIFNGEPGSTQVRLPVVLGHEFSGIVEQVGEAVTAVAAGDHVTVDPNIYCGKCMPCRMGKKQSCEHLEGIGVNRNGGFARYSLVPQTQCFRLDPSVDFDAGAMTEPLACALHGIDRAGIQPGQTVVVIGGGTIGLMMVQLARLSGATCLILSEPNAMRRKIGLEVGADAAIDPIGEDLPGRVAEISGRAGADVVIECVGKPVAAQQAFQVADRGATILLFSVPQQTATIPLPLFDVFSKELKILGSFVNPDTHQRAVNLLCSGRLEVQRLITHTYGLNSVEQAIRMQTQDASIKVLVHPQED